MMPANRLATSLRLLSLNTLAHLLSAFRSPRSAAFGA
jgi:hypothetical protein